MGEPRGGYNEPGRICQNGGGQGYKIESAAGDMVWGWSVHGLGSGDAGYPLGVHIGIFKDVWVG
jgi:hypothetical protein